MRTLLMSLALVMNTSLLCSAEPYTGDDLKLKQFLVLPRVGRYGRVPIHVDPVAAQIAGGTWKAPQAGDQVTSADGQDADWSKVDLTSEGWLEHESLRGGYAYTQVESPRQQVALLEATGHAMVFVNGGPRAGDPYLAGRTIAPVLLKSGANDFLFHAAAGKLQAKLAKPEKEVFLDTRDITLPTLVRGENEVVWLGLLVVNCREQALAGAQIRAGLAGGEIVTSKIDSVPPLGVRKVAVPLLPTWNETTDAASSATIVVSLETGGVKSEVESEIKIVDSNQPQTRTFRSDIDGSVQAYQLMPKKMSPNAVDSGLFVSLHDADESSADHIQTFAAVDGVAVISPGGRRAEGCDWENWSARDALEALDDAAKHLTFDAKRVWLRGTGSGGHGVLRLGGIAPDRWAALAPRTPWLEYPISDNGSEETRIDEMLVRVEWSNRLTPLLRNVAGTGILLEAEGTVEDPADGETREVVEALKAFHPDFHFESVSDDENLDTLSKTVEFCQKYSSQESQDVEEVDLVTYNPGLVARKDWLTIVSQKEQGTLTRAAVKFDPDRKIFVGLTANVAMLEIDVSHLESDTIVEVVLDGQAVGEFVVEGKALQFLQNDEGWHPIPLLPGSFKQPVRYGGMRRAFENHATLVYGTKGSPDENAWALAKARYDAETIWVRLNGSVDVVADTSFDARAARDRNVVLYGNADSNAAWPRLLSDSPVQVRQGRVQVERRPEMGDDLACVFVRPRRRSTTALVGVIGGTGIAGMRATDRLPLFVNGVVFPDLLLFSDKSLTEGNSDVRAAGYFGRVWAVDPGEIVWRDVAL